MLGQTGGGEGGESPEGDVSCKYNTWEGPANFILFGKRQSRVYPVSAGNPNCIY